MEPAAPEKDKEKKEGGEEETKQASKEKQTQLSVKDEQIIKRA